MFKNYEYISKTVQVPTGCFGSQLRERFSEKNKGSLQKKRKGGGGHHLRIGLFEDMKKI